MTTIAPDTETRTYTRHTPNEKSDLLTHRSLWPEGLKEITVPEPLTSSYDCELTWNLRGINFKYIASRRAELPRELQNFPNDDGQRYQRNILASAHERLFKIALKENFKAALDQAQTQVEDYTTTLAALVRTWEALSYTSTDVWNAAALTLQQAQDTHQDAANTLDDTMRKALRALTSEHGCLLSFDDLDEAITERGSRFASLVSAFNDDYRNPYSPPETEGVAAPKAHKLIAHQRDQLRRAAEMMPTPGKDNQ